MRTIAVGVYQGSVTLLFVSIFPTPLALCCCFATLACVARLVTVETPQRVRDKQVHLHLQISSYDFLCYFRSEKHHKQSVGRDNLPLFLHCYMVNLYNTLRLQLVSDLDF